MDKYFFKKLHQSLEDFFGMKIFIEENNNFNIFSKLEKRLKKIAKHDMVILMNIAQTLLIEYNNDEENHFFRDLIEEIVHNFISFEIIKVTKSKQKYFFDHLKRLSTETYENENSCINILLFNDNSKIISELEFLDLHLIKNTGGLTFDSLFKSKLTLKLLDGKNSILVIDSNLNIIGIATNNSNNSLIKEKVSNKIREIDNSLLRYFFYLYITSLFKENEKLINTVEFKKFISKREIQNVIKFNEELLVYDIKEIYKEYRKYMGSFLLIEIEKGSLNLYLNNSLDNYLSYNNTKWKYKSFYLFQFLIIESLYKDRLIKYPESNLQNHEYMKTVIDNINSIIKLLKHLSSSRKGALILILKEDIENFEENIEKFQVEKKLNHPILLSPFSYEENIYKNIILNEGKTKKISEFHFNFLELLSTIDGALILDSSFNVLSFGELIKLNNTHNYHLGARTNAGLSASKYALAIKVSEDGEIIMYDNENTIIKI